MNRKEWGDQDLDTQEKNEFSGLDQQAVNTIRFLSVDAVQKADSGHPGLPLDAAPMAYVLWMRFMKFNPQNPNWFDRDRFILSAGHGSMLLYSLLYLTGYNLSLDQIKQFRQWESKTPGHPERGVTPGVETTTGPLGQGFGNGVGMAIAEANLAARYNRPGFPIVDHYTYSIVSDGDLMEGISAEAASLAGHLKLGKLIYLYDNNHVSLSAGTDLTFTEDVSMRFKAYGWQVLTVQDGNELNAIDGALRYARQETEKPTLIMVHTHLGYGSPHKQDTFEAHGSPLGEEEVKETKENLGWPADKTFYVPDQVLEFFRQAVPRGQEEEKEWEELLRKYADKYPDQAEEFNAIMRGEIAQDWAADLPKFSSKDGKVATRVAVGKAMNASANRLPALIGGSADLDPSTHTQLKGLGDFESPAEKYDDTQGSSGGGLNYAGRNIHYGVREHAMGAITNGIAVHGGLLPFEATFLIFSDYMRPPIRLAALMKAHEILVFTHDSIALGEDGPTHQPVEQLLGLRSIPGMVVIRPADVNETVCSRQVAVDCKNTPVALVLTRQKVPVLDLDHYPQLPDGVKKGGYILEDWSQGGQNRLAIIATGSEVHLALEARQQLDKENISARVVSLPSWNIFQTQPREYQDQVLPANTPMLSIEAGVTLGWVSYVGPSMPAIGVNHFGASAPGEVVYQEYGFTVEHVVQCAKKLIDKVK